MGGLEEPAGAVFMNPAIYIYIYIYIYIANTSGLLKKTTSTTLSPGAFYLHTCRTTAQANDATYVLKKNSLSSADLNSLHLTNVMNSCLPAATETKPSCATTDLTNLALNIYIYIYI